MEISGIQTVNQKIHDYLDHVFEDYSGRITCPMNIENYDEWFTQDFLPTCITRWYVSSSYDINNIYTIEQFFCNNVVVYSEILQLLREHFDTYNKTMNMDKFDPKNVMSCYTCIYVCNNLDYFLEKYRSEFDFENDVSNDRSETSDIVSIDLFQSTEPTIEDNEDNNIPIQPLMFVNVIGYDNTDEEDDTDEEDNSENTINDNQNLPELINYIDDDSDTGSLLEVIDDRDEEYGFFETGIFVTENEFIEKNKNVECIICWDVVMNHENSMKWNNCNHFSCITCHDMCMLKKLYKCPFCRV